MGKPTDLSSDRMDIRTKDEFIYFMQRACEDTSNDCYIELYNILLRAFISADKDFDGKVDEGEFEGMINAAQPSHKSLVWNSGRTVVRISLPPLMKMEMEPFPSMSGLALPTITTRPNPWQPPLTSLTK